MSTELIELKDMGDFRVVLEIVNGKQQLTVTNTHNKNCLIMMPTSSNQIILKSDLSLKTS